MDGVGVEEGDEVEVVDEMGGEIETDVGEVGGVVEVEAGTDETVSRGRCLVVVVAIGSTVA